MLNGVKFLKSFNRKRYLAISLSIVLFISYFIQIEPIILYGASSSDYKFTSFKFTDGNGNSILDGDISNETGTIYIYGLHKDSDSGVGYHTVAYNFNLDSSGSGNSKGSKYYDDSFSYVTIKRTEDGDWGPRGNLNVTAPRAGMVWDVYKLDGDKVVNALIKLMKAKPDVYPDSKAMYSALASGVYVKISNEFEVIYRSSGNRIGTDTYKSLKKMRESVNKLLGVDWSSTTYNEVLPYYYDNAIKIQINPFVYNVKYVEKSDFEKNLKSNTLSKVNVLNTVSCNTDHKIMYGQELEYDLKDRNNVTVANSKVTYTYSSAQYYYSNGTKNNETIPTCVGNIVKTTHFRHYDGILYIILEVKKDAVPPHAEITLTPIPGEGGSSTSVGINHFDASATGVINADSKGSERFDVTDSIPTTEDLYCLAQGSQYLINAKFSIKSGTKVYPISVSKTYKVVTQPEIPEKSEEDQDSKATPMPVPTPIVTYETKTQTVYISRDYEYTEIDSIDYYKISSATITNGALPSGSQTITPSSYSVPSLNYTHYSESQHIVEPNGVNQSITLPGETVDDEAPNEDFTSTVDGMIGQIKVKSDYMKFAMEFESLIRYFDLIKREIL